MALNDKIFFTLLFVVLWCYGHSSSFVCQKLDNQLQQLCSNINGGYNFTASFKSVNGVSYQDGVYSKVLHLQRELKTCSNVSELMICSRFVPKCVEGRSSPVLPCREICAQFVDQCGSKLEERNLKVLYATICNDLPHSRGDEDVCIEPKGLEKQEKHKKLAISFNCSSQTIPACIQGNYSQLPEDIRTKLTKSLSHSQPLIKNGCAEYLKRYSCYVQTTPCYMHSRLPYRPCRWHCELMRKECDREISMFNLSFPLCDELTEKDRVGDLCRMDSWPVPWPNITKKKEVQEKWRTCYCSSGCGQIKRTCKTKGSCFIQSQFSIDYGSTYTTQVCIHPGKQRDFICNNTKNYMYAKCCDQNYCNKHLEGMSRASTTTAKPTSIPITAVTNVTSTAKSTGNPSITNNVTPTEIQEAWKTCYCSSGCGQIKRTCKTKGSCFIQSLFSIDYGYTYTTQVCIHPGKQRDFICNNTKNYMYAKCCDQNYCNKHLEGMSRASTTTAKPTSIPITAVTNVTSTAKSKGNPSITNNVTPTGTPPPSILATTNNSSACTAHNGIYIITIRASLASVLAITFKH